MKSLKSIIVTVLLLVCVSAFAQSKKTEKIKVWGNCSVCKRHIEGAAKVPGVSTASWSTNTKLLTITYDPSKISSDQIEKNVAAVGYDTRNYQADDKAYNQLDACCQYARKTDAGQKKHN